jgi:hypothetical protein
MTDCVKYVLYCLLALILLLILDVPKMFQYMYVCT